MEAEPPTGPVPASAAPPVVEEPVSELPPCHQCSEISNAASGTAVLDGATPVTLPTSSKNSAHALGCAILDSLSAKRF